MSFGYSSGMESEKKSYYGQRLPHEYCGYCGTDILSLRAGSAGCVFCRKSARWEFPEPIPEKELARQREELRQHLNAIMDDLKIPRTK